MRFLFFLGFLVCFSLSFSQQLVWEDDFENSAANWTLNIETGQNDPDANLWVISDEEGGGVQPPNCSVYNNGNKTLHIECTGAMCDMMRQFLGVEGSSYVADYVSNKRAALNTPISTVGFSDLELQFNWLGKGAANVDLARLEYSIDGGGTWTVLWSQTPQQCWTAATVALPANLENQSDLRFAFNWTNAAASAGADDPAFAVDNMKLFSNQAGGNNPVANFTTPSQSICSGECIDFTDASTGTNISAWNWTFTGADTPSSSEQNPTNICFPNEGTFDVKLTVTDDFGTDTKTIQITVADCSGPNANFSTQDPQICAGKAVNFIDNSTGVNINSWNWTFDGGQPGTSTDRNPTGIIFASPGTYSVTLEITDDNGTNSKTQQIVVQDCGTVPTASFVASSNTICAGDCISFTDKSAGSPTSWSWTFDGGIPSTSNKQNPSKVCFNTPGSHDVTLNVSNTMGSDQVITTINVLALPEIIGVGDTFIEMGGSAELHAIPISQGNVIWKPNKNLDCDTCLTVIASPLTTTVYYPTIIDANGCVGRDTVTVIVEVKDLVDVPSAFSPNGDKQNDKLRVYGVGIQEMEFKIYNRYGQLVFSTTKVNEGWDGTMNGRPLNQGVFVYTLKYRLINGLNGKKTGNITLVK